MIYLLVGILGFVPGLVGPPPADAPDLAVHHNYGYLLGMFPINTPHNIVHLLIGLWGLGASRSWGGGHTFSAGLAVL